MSDQYLGELRRLCAVWFVVGWGFGLCVTPAGWFSTWLAWLLALVGALFGFLRARRREIVRRRRWKR